MRARRRLLCLGMILLPAAGAMGQINATWDSSPFGNWTDGFRWSTNPVFPHNGQPNPTDLYNATVPGGFVTLNQNIALQNYTMSAGSLNNQAGAVQNTLTVNQAFTWQGGEIEGRVTLDALGGIAISGASIKRMDAFNSTNLPVINNHATATFSGGGVNATVVSDASGVYFPTFNNLAGATFLSQADSFFNVRIDNAGTFTRNTATGNSVHRAPFNNAGWANINTGSVELARGGSSTGTFSVAAGARLYFLGHELLPGSTVTGSGTIRFTNPSGGGAGGATVVSGAYNVGATVLDGLIAFNTSGTTGSLSMNRSLGEPILGSGTLTVTGPATYINGNYAGSVTIKAAGGLDFAITTNPRWSENARLQLAGGTSIWSGSFNILEFRENARFEILSGATFDVVHNIGNREIKTFTTGGAFSNAGTLLKSGNGGLAVQVPATNTGFIQVSGGSVGFSAGLVQDDPAAEIRLLNNARITGPIDLVDGRLTGSGTVAGAVESSCTIAPGLSAGLLRFQSPLTLLPGGTVEVELGGTAPGTQYDVLHLDSGATLGGALAIALDAFTPAPGQLFKVIDAPFGGVTGTFASITGREVNPTTWLATLYAPGGVTLAVALPGDANLDGIVNIADFAILAANFNAAGNWLSGNFNGDALVEIGDFSLLAANFNQSLPAEVSRPGAVPEPAMAAGLAALLLGGNVGRHRKIRV